MNNEPIASGSKGWERLRSGLMSIAPFVRAIRRTRRVTTIAHVTPNHSARERFWVFWGRCWSKCRPVPQPQLTLARRYMTCRKAALRTACSGCCQRARARSCNRGDYTGSRRRVPVRDTRHGPAASRGFRAIRESNAPGLSKYCPNLGPTNSDLIGPLASQWGRGRDGSCEPPPAQIPASAANALGSYLGFSPRSVVQATDEERGLVAASAQTVYPFSPNSSGCVGSGGAGSETSAASPACGMNR